MASMKLDFTIGRGLRQCNVMAILTWRQADGTVCELGERVMRRPVGQEPLRLGVLGPARADDDGVWVLPPTRQIGRIVTVLAGWPTEPVDRERIIAAVWADKSPATAVNTLQVHVSHVRRWLGKDAVYYRSGAYTLDFAPHSIDVYRFDALLEEAAGHRRDGDARAAMGNLTTAMALVRGLAFPDVVDTDLIARRSRIAERVEQAGVDLLECRLAAVTDDLELADVIASAREQVSRHPRWESTYAVLMRALSVANRLADEADVFLQAAQALASDGLKPSDGLRDLHEQCQRRDPQLVPDGLRG